MMCAAQIDEKYCCPVCCDVLKLPVVTPCDHLFCTECLHESIKRNGDTCPVCRAAISWKKCKKNSILEKEIHSVNLTCTYCGKRKIPLLLFNSHISSCPNQPQLPKPQFKPVKETTQSIPNPGPNRVTFTCPICHQTNFDCSGLREHCNTKHSTTKSRVVCPICASMPWGDPSKLSNDFIAHLNLRHTFEYDTYVDYQQDEDLALSAALQASLQNN